MFTDPQLAAILGTVSALGALFVTALKWMVNRISNAIDAATTAQLEGVKAMTALATKVDAVAEWCDDHTPVETRPSSRAGGYGPGPPGRGG